MKVSLDTLARLAATTDYEYAAKQLVLVMTRTLEQLNQMNPNDPAGETNRAKDLLYIFCEIFSYCLVNSPYPLTHKVFLRVTSYFACFYISPTFFFHFSVFIN